MSTSEPFVVMAKPVGPICNLNCGYCYYLGKTSLFGPHERFRMSDDVLAHYVRSFIGSSSGPVVHFVWHGGEPTLAGRAFYQRAIEYQQRYLPEGWTALNSLQTNGTRLDEAWCAFLAEHRFAVGISIDGPAAFHDASRPDRHGGTTHERAVRGFRLLRDHGIDADVLCTLNAANMSAPLEVYRFFLAEGVRWLQFLPVVQRNADGRVSARSVHPEAMGEFLCSVYDEWIRHDLGRIDVQVFLECLTVWAGNQPTLCTMSETCGRALAVEHDGSVFACDHFVDPGHRLGGVANEGLAALVDSARQVAFGAEKSTGLTQTCRECPVEFVCRGGCPKDRFVDAPDGEPGHNYLCAGYRQFFTHIAPTMERMVGLGRRFRPVATLMDELREEEVAIEAPWRSAGRNDACPCGSGRKYKHCCLGSHRPR